MWSLLVGTALAAPTYTLSFDQRNANTLSVEVQLPAGSDELMMATWTPGSYLVREFAQHVSSVVARRGDAVLDVTKTAKNRWTVAGDGRPYTLRYDVYAHADNVRGNWVDDEFAVLNGAASYILPVGAAGPFDIVVERPDGWARTVTSLTAQGSGYRAGDVDELIDSPVLVGNPTITTFLVDDVPHHLVDLPAAPGWDSRKAARDLTKVVEQNRRFWGRLPYDDYHFLNWIGEGRGGLEHADSTLMMTGRRATSNNERLQRWLGLASHEHFHAWNAKRLHPRGLGPFDYEKEVYTPDLWIVEGITSYYDDLMLVRAGLLSREAYLGVLSRGLDGLVNTPGRNVMSLEQASHDAWVKHYRPTENSGNTTVSYYSKGALVAWVLDARIRSVTDGQASLDDVMRLAWERLKGDPGYVTRDFLDLIDEVAGEPMGPFLLPLIRGTAPLDHATAARVFGLMDLPATTPPEPWLGLDIAKDHIRRIRADGPAAPSPLAVGDEILAIDGERHRADVLEPLERRRPGDTVSVLYARRGLVRETRVVLGSRPHPVQLAVADGNRRQERQRIAWLTGTR